MPAWENEKNYYYYIDIICKRSNQQNKIDEQKFKQSNYFYLLQEYVCYEYRLFNHFLTAPGFNPLRVMNNF